MNSRTKTYCHATCCAGETQLTRENQDAHLLQWILDRLGCPSGHLGKDTPSVLQAMTVAKLYGVCITSQMFTDLFQGLGLSLGIGFEETITKAIEATAALGVSPIDRLEMIDRAFLSINGTEETIMAIHTHKQKPKKRPQKKK